MKPIELLKESQKEFDEKFGKDGAEQDSDSIGRIAGCDDCNTNIKLRQEHKQFLTSLTIKLLEGEIERLKDMLEEDNLGEIDENDTDAQKERIEILRNNQFVNKNLSFIESQLSEIKKI